MRTCTQAHTHRVQLSLSLHLSVFLRGVLIKSHILLSKRSLVNCDGAQLFSPSSLCLNYAGWMVLDEGTSEKHKAALPRPAT